MRLRHAVDKTQAEIVSALRQAGACVEDLSAVGRGVPDLLVAYHDRRGAAHTILVECKSARGTLTPDEIRWLHAWHGQVAICYSAEDALMAIGAV
jgi:hypothetical protein